MTMKGDCLNYYMMSQRPRSIAHTDIQDWAGPETISHCNTAACHDSGVTCRCWAQSETIYH